MSVLGLPDDKWLFVKVNPYFDILIYIPYDCVICNLSELNGILMLMFASLFLVDPLEALSVEEENYASTDAQILLVVGVLSSWITCACAYTYQMIRATALRKAGEQKGGPPAPDSSTQVKY
jgi:hypothetical protein